MGVVRFIERKLIPSSNIAPIIYKDSLHEWVNCTAILKVAPKLSVELTI